MNSPTPDQARQQLDEAASRGEAADTDSWVGALFTGTLGILIAGTLAAVNVWDGRAGATISMGVFSALLFLLMWWHRRRMRISNHGWALTYLLGFGLTMALYVIGIMWGSFAFPGWAIFGPYCVLVATPAIVAAARMLRR